MSQSRLFTGIQASGSLTLGNYCGVIHHILKIQDRYEIIIMIADLHSLTVPKPNFNYREKCREIASLLYACGLKEEKCKIFIQSEIKEHTELTWLLSPYITVGKLGDMIQYKEKKGAKETGNLALLSYPVLMAADIFLYDPDLVIVGQDQKQHLELTKDIAKNFNNFCGKELLKIPKFEIPKFGAKIMGLKDPTKKMSKSENDYISLLDKPEEITKKIMRALTDSNQEKISYEPEKRKGISNLLTIYALLNNEEIEEAEEKIKGFNHYQFKLKIIDLLNEKLGLIQEKYNKYFAKIDVLLNQNKNELEIQAKEKLILLKKELKI